MHRFLRFANLSSLWDNCNRLCNFRYGCPMALSVCLFWFISIDLDKMGNMCAEMNLSCSQCLQCQPRCLFQVPRFGFVSTLIFSFLNFWILNSFHLMSFLLVNLNATETAISSVILAWLNLVEEKLDADSLNVLSFVLKFCDFE